MLATTLPDLSTLDDDALAALLADLEARFDQLHDGGSGDLAEMSTLADTIDAARSAQTDRTGRLALAERVHPQPAQPVMAAFTLNGNRPNLAAVARQAPRPAAPSARRTTTITAAGGEGRRLADSAAIAVELHRAARGLADPSPPTLVASIDTGHPVLDRDLAQNANMLREVVGQPDAAALVASGGWCAPSEPLFELFNLGPDTEGLIDLPSLTVRAGALIPTYFGFGDVAEGLWTWTEADDIAAAGNTGVPGDTVKPCISVPCPTWTEVRLFAEGLCVTHGNLQDRAWPELSRSFVDTVFGAHAHRVSASMIAKIAADAATVTLDASMKRSDAAGDLLGAIGLAAADARSQYRLGRRRAVDIVLPDWTIEALRSNVAQRAGVDLLSVSDSQLIGWFTNRGVRPQFVSDYQPLYGSAPATKWPATVEFLAWISGSYVQLDGGSINVGVQRDSVMNSTNDFTLAWSEQFMALGRLGPAARKYSVALDIDGVTGCCPVAP